MSPATSSTKISPDGGTVAFRWAVSGEPQLWVVAAEGGFPQQLTFGGSVTFFEWTPDGANLLVARDADGFRRYQQETGATICGRAAIEVLLRTLPAELQATLVAYETSGAITGAMSRPPMASPDISR